MEKLDVYGIHGVELSWFRNYLSERRQRVLLDGEHSDWTGLTKGVPQGSILGPMLFLLFVNDLSDVVEHCTVNLYADDTTIYSTDENPVVLGARMEKDLESVANWIEMNDLKMNVVKTVHKRLLNTSEDWRLRASEGDHKLTFLSVTNTYVYTYALTLREQIPHSKPRANMLDN